MPFEIKSNEIASAIFGGFSTEEFKSGFTQGWGDSGIDIKALTSKITNAYKSVSSAFSKGASFFKSWFKDDPVGASAGVLAAGLAVGVVLVVGGAAIGAVATGLAGISTMGLLGKIGVALGVGSAAGILGSVVRWCVRGTQFLWNFNFNVTDKELKSQQESIITNLYGAVGGALGASAASLLCGAAPVELIKRSRLVKVNPMLLAHLKELSELDPKNGEIGEIYEEAYESIVALLNLGARSLGRYVFLESYKNIRKWIKNGFRYSGLSQIFPKLGKVIADWGKEGSEAWTIAEAIEERIESIENSRIERLVEEAYEEFTDVCTENVMIISYAI